MTMENEGLTPERALRLLLDGNDRFVKGLRSVESLLSAVKLKEYAEKGQRPFAVILTCSDSRVPVEIVFDQGVGSLFVIRVAGNIVTPSLIASVEFAVLNLGVPLCLVMGHTGCGAVQAAIDQERNGEPLGSIHIEQLVRKIKPAVDAVLKDKRKGEENFAYRVTAQNVHHSVNALIKKSPPLQQSMDGGKLMVVGSVYDLHSGKVHLDLPMGFRES